MNSSERDIIDFHHSRPWRPIVRRSAIFISIIFALVFYHLLFSFQNLNAVVLPSREFILGTPRTVDSSLTITSLQNTTSHVSTEFELPILCIFGVRSSDGAFGNRMFLFASAFGLARIHACHLYISSKIIFDLQSTFKLNLNQTSVKLLKNPAEFENRTDIFQRYSACTLFDDLFKIPLNPNFTRYELIGFYQAFGYFDRFRQEVAQLFEFNSQTIKYIIPFVEQLIQSIWNYSINFNHTNTEVTHTTLKSFLLHPPAPLIRMTWIGVHIRRGDFLTFFKIDTSLSYLSSSMDHYRQRYRNCRFLIASDDKTYVKEHFGKIPDVFITPSTFFHGHDLAALALCEHSILTAGTFSWWSAWLAGGNVIHDLNYPVPFQKCDKESYFPPWFLFPYNSSSKRWEPSS
ncbi:unnamed protein product [Rotaria sordida]|uniref:L-Fucosyltransferase n=1 Tax=Rotaria sordida TaxID=392033 RepID=A0A813UNN4_9BILA|nr:unnamed protein product [Rotaria sordida]CAF1092858.1 unnamed protein product [Rotaria sordida]CAF3518117.1 unnamed protein product [Rotaria sordida]CAF3868469.1 unnamed protein product [Rotaria sordida]